MLSPGRRCKIFSSSSQLFSDESVYDMSSCTINYANGLIEVSRRLNTCYLESRPLTNSSLSRFICPSVSILSLSDSLVTTGYSSNMSYKFFNAEVFGWKVFLSMVARSFSYCSASRSIIMSLMSYGTSSETSSKVLPPGISSAGSSSLVSSSPVALVPICICVSSSLPVASSNKASNSSSSSMAAVFLAAAPPHLAF